MDARLKALLDTPPLGSLDSRLRELLEKGEFALFGAGQNAKHVLEVLASEGIKPLCLIDDTPSKQGQLLHGISIKSLADFQQRPRTTAVISTVFNPKANFSAIAQKLTAAGVEQVHSFLELFPLFPHAFLPMIHFDHPEQLVKGSQAAIQKAFECLGDEPSKELFLQNLGFRLSYDVDMMPAPDGNFYFPEELVQIPEGAIFIDCGAYDGDTIQHFLRLSPSLAAVHAYEPDLENHEKICRAISELSAEHQDRIVSYPMGVAEATKTVRFSSSGTMASSIDAAGETTAEVVDLDTHLLPSLQDDAPLFLKLDVEGVEPLVLQGAANLIKTRRPTMAISAYHNPNDLWHLIELVQEIQENYRFYYRQHGGDTMDLVLYALPN